MRRTALIILSILLLLAHPLWRVFIADTFIVRGDSMFPALRDGERIKAVKTKTGPRIYTSFDFSGEELRCFRIAGLGKAEPGDIVVLNNPDPNKEGKIAFKINVVYAKRCIGGPGDTLRIKDGYFLRNGKHIGSFPQQEELSRTPDSLLEKNGVYMPAFPYLPGWTIKNMGPVYIPRRGDSVEIDPETALVYARAIEYETGIPQDSIIKSLRRHTFSHDYYFFAGDNVLNSRDSRYFGIVPDDFIIGTLRDGRRKYDQEYKAGIERTLAFAGENASQLEYVLDWYKDRPQEYRAAEFLISGMEDKYGVTAEGDRIYDARIITADYLKTNIEDALRQYRTRPWNRGLTEDEFHELLLPYRFHHEPLSPWREKYRNRFSRALDGIGEDVLGAVNAINAYLKDTPFRLDYVNHHRNAGADTLLSSMCGDCQAQCDFFLYLFHSLGIPATTDSYKTGNIHSWNVVRDTDGRYELFIPDYFGGKGTMKGGLEGRTKGKVVRDVWHSPGRKDVTQEYYGENSIRAASPALGIYTRGGISMLSAGQRCIGGYRYRNLEPGKVYFPMEGNETDGYPFILFNDGKRKISLKPDLENRSDVVLWRKVRMYGRLYERMNTNEGVLIEGSMDSDFTRSDTLGILGRTLTNYNRIILNGHKPYRYYRLCSPKGKGMKLAEIKLFADQGEQIKLSIFQTSKRSGGTAENLLDDDPLSYFESDGERPFIIFDAGDAVEAQVMEWVPLNDDNFVRVGDEYELFYFAGKKGWSSAGVQVASGTRLTFENVPSNALLLLHDRTRGVEEEVFVMAGGRQLFL